MARRSGITETNISLLENERVDIGKKRAVQLADAFSVHPAIIMFPENEQRGSKRLPDSSGLTGSRNSGATHQDPRHPVIRTAIPSCINSLFK